MQEAHGPTTAALYTRVADWPQFRKMLDAASAADSPFAEVLV